MTFTRTVKNELITIPIELNEMQAEFAAFLNLACEFHIEENQKLLDFQTKNPTVTKRFLLLSKALFKVDTILLKKDQQMFSKKPLIILRITNHVEEIINNYDYLGEPIEQSRMLTQTKNTKKAFLRAAFLVSGSVNHPKTAEYHLEIFADKKEEIVFIQALMNYFNLNARVAKRRKGYIAYLKDAESISEFMQLLGAKNAVFAFEDIRIKRDFNNSINRLMNCEIANEKKAFVASQDQLNDIELIESFYIGNEVDEKTKQAIKLRKKYPDSNLRELTLLYEEEYNDKISKSGLNHRFLKIKKIAEKLREDK